MAKIGNQYCDGSIDFDDNTYKAHTIVLKLIQQRNITYNKAFMKSYLSVLFQWCCTVKLKRLNIFEIVREFTSIHFHAVGYV